MPHTTRVRLDGNPQSVKREVEIIDEDGRRWRIPNKTSRWLETKGAAKWIGPHTMILIFQAKEYRGLSSNGFIVMQLAALRDRRAR